MQKAISYVLWMLTAAAVVLVVWLAPLSLADRTRVRVALAEEKFYARDVLSDDGMSLFQLKIAEAIVADGEWIRANLPEDLNAYYERELKLKYIADPKSGGSWQTPRETQERGGGDCEDLTTHQLAFGMTLNPEVYKLGFIVLYPEEVVVGVNEGHMAMIIETGKIFVWDLAFEGMRNPIPLLEYLEEFHRSDIAMERPITKYYRIWWLFEKNPDLQPEMEFMPVKH